MRCVNLKWFEKGESGEVQGKELCCMIQERGEVIQQSIDKGIQSRCEKKVFWLSKDAVCWKKWDILLAYSSLLDVVYCRTASSVFLVSKIRMNLTVSNEAWACITKFQISLLDINRWIYSPFLSWCVISTICIVLFMQMGCYRRQSHIPRLTPSTFFKTIHPFCL